MSNWSTGFESIQTGGYVYVDKTDLRMRIPRKR